MSKEIQNKLTRLENLLEELENIRLIQLVESRKNNDTVSFEDVVNESGFSMDEIKELAESVELE